MHVRQRPVLHIAAALVVASCRHSPPPEPPAPAPPPAAPAPNADSVMRVRATADSAARAESRRRSVADSTSRALAAARDAEAVRLVVGRAVHFDFDRSTLGDEAKATLDAKTQILLANPQVTLRIVGHADERGSGEYNLALGHRRALSVRDYLANRGVSATRIEIVSFGEERPVCDAETEECWAMNRRDEFEIVAGGATLRRP